MVRLPVTTLFAVVVGLGIGLSSMPGNAASGPSGSVGSDGVFRYDDPSLKGQSTTTLTGHLVVSHADPAPGTDQTPREHAASIATAIGSDEGPLIGVRFDASVGELLERFGGGAVSAEVVNSESSGYVVANATVVPANAVGPDSAAGVSAQATVGSAPPPITSTPMAHHADVVLLDNSGDWTSVGTDDATRETIVRSELQKTLDWWRDESGGQISSFTIDEYKHYASALSNAGPDPCGAIDDGTFEDFYNEAAAKFATDFTAAGNHLLMVVAPDCSTTGDESIGRGFIGPLGLGFGSSGSEHFEVSNFTESLRFETATHELGHNFGLEHAFWRNPNGTVNEYADQYSPMGFGHFGESEWSPPRLSQAHRAMLAVQDPNEVQLVSSPETLPGVNVTISARGGSADPRAVEIPVKACPENTLTSIGDPDRHCTAWLEFRNGGDFDAASWYPGFVQFSTGVTATETFDGWGVTLLVTTSDYETGKVPGSYGVCSVIDLGSVKATVTATSASGATVHVGPKAMLPASCPAKKPVHHKHKHKHDGGEHKHHGDGKHHRRHHASRRHPNSVPREITSGN